jgi:hypothetical protein
MSKVDRIAMDMDSWMKTFKLLEEELLDSDKLLNKAGVPELDKGGSIMRLPDRIGLLLKKVNTVENKDKPETGMTRTEAIRCLSEGKLVICVDCGAFTRYKMFDGVLKYFTYDNKWTECSFNGLSNTHDYVLPGTQEGAAEKKYPVGKVETQCYE